MSCEQMATLALSYTSVMMYSGKRSKGKKRSGGAQNSCRIVATGTCGEVARCRVPAGLGRIWAERGGCRSIGSCRNIGGVNCDQSGERCGADAIAQILSTARGHRGLGLVDTLGLRHRNRAIVTGLGM